MSTRSSSGSWSDDGRSPPDIIDLDKFMRGAVRPTRGDTHTLRCSDKLVVDAGGVDRSPGTAAVPAPTAPLTPPAPSLTAPLLTAPSDSSDSRPRPHGKRFSHDSGLSDTSYARRKHRLHRRAVGGDCGGQRVPRSQAGGAAGVGSSASLRAFRVVCERALLDQQEQIARVAQLCERLSERPSCAPPASVTAPPSSATAAPSSATAPPSSATVPPRRRSECSATDSSDVSSSSRSTRDQRRKDKHRTEECKTYKIIMNKLDELNRLFAARARSPPPASRDAPPLARSQPRAPRDAPPLARSPPRAASRRAPVSSGSVSVSDKLVSTEPDRAERSRDLTRELQVLHNVVTIRGGSTYGACGPSGPGAVRRGGSCAGGARHAAHSLARACALEVAPSDALPQHIATESVAQCESRPGTGTSGGDPRCGFDLDDPVHLYSQAKRLQAMSATTRRARSVEPSGRHYERFGQFEHDTQRQRSPGAASRTRERAGEHPRAHSLCSLCRGYWRSFTHYLAAQIFCCPDAAGAVR